MTTRVSEGSLASLQVCDALATRPGSVSGFYNVKQVVRRDLCVLSCAVALRRRCRMPGLPFHALDAFASSGVQGIRLANECPLLVRGAIGMPPSAVPPLKVTLNDEDAVASNLCASNASGSGISILQRNAAALLHEQSFDASLLDPFGSVALYLDACMAKAPHGSTLELTTTDLEAVYGARPDITRRTYAARVPAKRPFFFRELGVRVLIGAAVRAANRHGRGIIPLFVVSSDEHWVHVSLRVEKGGRAADLAEANVRRFCICKSYGTGFAMPLGTTACQDCNGMCPASEGSQYGPVWLGPLYDRSWLEEMAAMSVLPNTANWFSKKTHKLLQTLVGEAQVPPERLFYQRPAAANSLPKLAHVMRELRESGFVAARTHFDPLAIRTDAPPREFDAAVRRACSE